MRLSFCAPMALAATLALAPHRAPAQVSVSLRFGRPLVVTNYSPDAYGDWHSRYRYWHPTTVYYLDGRWYPRRVRGSRPVVVYRTGSSYFLPPRDRDWDQRDRRYNYRRRPSDEDYTHAAEPAPRGRPHP